VSLHPCSRADISIAGIYLSSARRANQHWTLLGSVTKIAMALGLASVPDEAKIISGEIKRIPTRWRNTVDREVARRVWYCLLELDQLFAIEYGFLYLISPEISQTTEPANINDADIKPDQPVHSLPRDTYTVSSTYDAQLTSGHVVLPATDAAVLPLPGGRAEG
jgi:hypothetical protein